MPSEPGVVAFGALIGAFAGHTYGLIRRRDHEARVRGSVNGSYCGTAIALTIYVLTNVRDAGIL